MELNILHPYFIFDQIKTTLATKQHMHMRPGLTKQVLLPLLAVLIFHHKHKGKYMNKLLNFTFTTSYHSVVYFSWLLAVAVRTSGQEWKCCPGDDHGWLCSPVMFNKPHML